MKKSCTLIIVFLSFFCYPQKKVAAINSVKLDEKREISIYLPSSYEKNKEKKYPLLLLMDGHYLFDAFTGALTYGIYWDELPEMIIVGINQSTADQRERDVTISPEDGLPIDKGAKFYEFLTTELLPGIQKDYRIAPFRIIAGHEITGSYINLFLYNNKPLFNAYIALSPELDENMEARVAEQLSKIKSPVFYYQSVADGDLKTTQSAVAALDTNIKAITNTNLFYKFDSFKNTSHYAAVLYAIPNALYHLFSIYPPISTSEYKEKIVTLKSDYTDYLSKKYDIIQNTYGIKIPIRLNDFKAIEAAIIKNEDFNELEKLAQLANTNYPKAMLGEYYVALYYEKKGDIKRAAKSYQTAYTMEPIGDLTKDEMITRAESFKNKLKKDKKNSKVTEETEPAPETPKDKP